MQGYFFDLVERLNDLLQGDEVYTCAFVGEESDFVRFNQCRVRQAGHVIQRALTLDLIEGRRHAAATLTLTGDLQHDRTRLAELMQELRVLRFHVPADLFLNYATDAVSNATQHATTLPDSSHMMAEIMAAGAGQQLVGILASGLVHAGFANSLGQRNWYTRASFNLDWSLYRHRDKAVKARYAGFDWEEHELQRRMQQALAQLAIFDQPARTLKPGSYRAYLAPMAMEEILELLSWSGFSLRAHRTGSSPLLRMVEKDVCLHPAVTLSENTAAGMAPHFQQTGFMRPADVPLIVQGCYQNSLISPRSAAEYQLACNGAEDQEIPLSLDMAPGDLPADAILSTLETGLYIGNLWYLNYSDRNAARLTGMTRFATFWVQNGRIQAPVNAMRFDESIYQLFGDRLLGLSAEREFLLDPGTYGARTSRSACLPGALVDGLRFTL